MNFHIGQEVVAVIDHSQGVFNKGDEFVINGIRQGCCELELDVGLSLPSGYIGTGCDHCGGVDRSVNMWFYATSFAPKTSFGEHIAEKIENEINEEITETV